MPSVKHQTSSIQHQKRALFLDRDGVINVEKDGSYIFSLHEFEFYPRAKEAIVMLSHQFDYTFIVTNQRGIGRGLMSEAALQEIHDYLIREVNDAGGRIDKIYYATAVDSNHYLRKPNTGMALQAYTDYPDFDFKQSVMVGNNISDMKFGKAMSMKTIFLHTTQSEMELPNALVDMQFASMYDYAASFNLTR